MTTRGDQILDRTLSKVGGKGLFVKELEVALLERRAQLAVHSLKDVPMELAPEFTLAAVMKREDPRDCLVSNRFASLDELPAGARVGTSSLRRELMLRARFPGAGDRGGARQRQYAARQARPRRFRRAGDGGRGAEASGAGRRASARSSRPRYRCRRRARALWASRC